MKNRKLILIASAIIVLVFIILYIKNLNNPYSQELYETNSSSFFIDVSTPIIENTPSQILEEDNLIEGSGEDRRLIISVSISPLTDEDFENTWFELELNPEVEPFIASQILKHKSDKFFVTTYEKAGIDSDTLKITGFEHTWNMSLTSNEDLMTIYNLVPEDIYNGLKSITVRIKWDGGSQEETVLLKIKSGCYTRN